MVISKECILNSNWIEIVCQRNQVRSPFLASFLNFHFSETEFKSSGISILSKSVFDLRAQEIAKSWGFEYSRGFSLKFSETQDGQIFLPVDEEIRKYLEANVKSGSILSSNLKSTSSELNIPIDHINSDSERMKYELAKLLGYGVRQVMDILPSPFQSNLTAIIPRSGDSYEDIFHGLLPITRKGEIVVIDACLKRSNFDLMTKIGFNTRQPLTPFEAGIAFSSDHELLESEKLLCSVSWRQWLLNLASFGKVIIVTPPRQDPTGRNIYDSFLAAIWSLDIWHL
jgi:protein-tyrosine-phosphatase